MHYIYGVLNLSFFEYIIAGVIILHITGTASSLYYHRSQSHNSVLFAPPISHFFRFWMWMTTTTITKEWVAVHRQHHFSCDKPGDPHSPVVFGITTVLFKGYRLYREAANNKAIIEQFSKGTPNDWLETHLYQKHRNLGIFLFFIINIVLFGIPGILITLVPIAGVAGLALGAVNGFAHYRGYRNFNTPDNSRNIFPLGIFFIGEELHHNHHFLPTTPYLAMKWYEFDLGGLYIRLLSWVGLAKVNKNYLYAKNKQCSEISYITGIQENN